MLRLLLTVVFYIIAAVLFPLGIILPGAGTAQAPGNGEDTVITQESEAPSAGIGPVNNLGDGSLIIEEDGEGVLILGDDQGVSN